MDIKDEIREYLQTWLKETDDPSSLTADIIFIHILDRFNIFDDESLEGIYTMIVDVGRENGLSL